MFRWKVSVLEMLREIHYIFKIAFGIVTKTQLLPTHSENFVRSAADCDRFILRFLDTRPRKLLNKVRSTKSRPLITMMTFFLNRAVAQMKMQEFWVETRKRIKDIRSLWIILLKCLEVQILCTETRRTKMSYRDKASIYFHAIASDEPIKLVSTMKFSKSFTTQQTNYTRNCK